MNYVVRSGDTLATIAGRFRMPVQTLIAANRITDPRVIHPGMTLYIPIPRPTPPPQQGRGGAGLEERVEGLETEVTRLQNEVDKLERSVRRLEGR